MDKYIERIEQATTQDEVDTILDTFSNENRSFVDGYVAATARVRQLKREIEATNRQLRHYVNSGVAVGDVFDAAAKRKRELN